MAAGPQTLIAGRYRVSGRVGTGGMGSVWMAQDSRLGRRVALKRIHPQHADGVNARFRREMRIGAAVSHPNLVTVFDALDEEGGVLLVMEYVEGQSLADALRRGPLDPERAIAVLSAAAGGLDHLHQEGIVHRDVKPANILLGVDGTVKLADLGIASSPDMTRITQSGSLLGTAAYMAPELFCGDPATAASDVYSLAAVAFESLSGRRARPARTPVEIARQAVDEPPPQLDEAWPGAPPGAAEALERGLCRDPAQRPASGGELVEELRAVLSGPAAPRLTPTLPPPAAVPGNPASKEAPTETRVPAMPRRRSARTAHHPGRRWALPVVVVAVLAGVVAALLAITGGDRSPSPRTRARPQSPTAPASPVAAGQPAAAADAPAATVRRFYELAAADRYREAWALAGPGLRDQLRGYEAFRGTFGSLQSISFPHAETTRTAGDRASVAIRTIAVHPDRTDRCSGTVDLIRAGPWKIDRLAVTC